MSNRTSAFMRPSRLIRTPPRFLVSGGGGFVGSPLVAALLDGGDLVVVIDNFSTGHPEAVLGGAEIVIGDTRNERLLDDVLADGPSDAVFHPAKLVADASRLQALGWAPRSTTAEAIVETAYAGRLAHPHGYASAVAPRHALAA